MTRYALIGFENTLAKNILNLLSLRGTSKQDVCVFEDKLRGTPSVSFGDEDIKVCPLSLLEPKDFDLIIFTGSKDLAARHARKFSARTKVLNATEAFLGEEDVPMIMGGVNDQALEKAQTLISVPSPHVGAVLGALSGLCQKYTFKTLRLCAYIGADFEEEDGMSALYAQTRKILMNDMSPSVHQLFHKTLAFNLIPQVGDFIGEETELEWRFNTESKQILGTDVKVFASCAFVSAFVGQGAFVMLETAEDLEAEKASKELQKGKGVLVLNKQEDGGYFSLTDTQGENSIFISRIRQDMTVENGLSFWTAGDVYKIAAQNILAVSKHFLSKDKR